jgi:hypothetical protein
VAGESSGPGVNLRVVNEDTQERDQLVARGLNGSALQHHPMVPDGASDENYARYKCRRCGIAFAVGYPAVAGASSGPRKLELFDRTALDTPCAVALFAVYGDLRSDSQDDAEAIEAVADALSKTNDYWTVTVAERPPGTSHDMALRTVSWVWGDVQDESASAEQGKQIFEGIFGSLYPGRDAPPMRWWSRPDR